MFTVIVVVVKLKTIHFFCIVIQTFRAGIQEVLHELSPLGRQLRPVAHSGQDSHRDTARQLGLARTQRRVGDQEPGAAIL